jgi:hypothetical protein
LLNSTPGCRTPDGGSSSRAKENVRDLVQRFAPLGGTLPCFWSVADAVGDAREVQPARPIIGP